MGAYVRINSKNYGTKNLKWSDVKDTLWGLREFMVVRGHLFEVVFVIQRRGDTLDVVDNVGFGRVDRAKGTAFKLINYAGGVIACFRTSADHRSSSEKACSNTTRKKTPVAS